MEGDLIKVKIATPLDNSSIMLLTSENATDLHYSPANFKTALDFILSNIDYGFFVYAYTDSDEPVAMMMFTYEWSDWRDGLFFWF